MLNSSQPILSQQLKVFLVCKAHLNHVPHVHAHNLTCCIACARHMESHTWSPFVSKYAVKETRHSNAASNIRTNPDQGAPAGQNTALSTYKGKRGGETPTLLYHKDIITL